MRGSFPDFATVLKQTEPTEVEEAASRNAHAGFASAIFEADLNPVSATQLRPAQFDIENAAYNVDILSRENAELVQRMKNQSSSQISAELGLRSDMNRGDLQRLRRSFAAMNHPDRLPQEFRLAAEQRMKTANALLDTAMANASTSL